MRNENLVTVTFPHLINLTKDEFIKQCKNNAIILEEIFHQILNNIYFAIVNFNINELKIQNKLINFIEDAICLNVMQHYYESKENPLRGTNIIILACKYNNVNSLNYIFLHNSSLLSFFNKMNVDLSPEAKDSECHNAFYYTLRSNNISILKVLIERWPFHCSDHHHDNLDECLSKTYNEVKLRNIELSDKIKLTIEEFLFNKRFFHNNSEDKETGTTTLKIKERVKQVLEAFSDLSSQVDSNIFLYLMMFIAKNIFVLKQQLKILYAVLPWEEMEFCLLSFINTSRKQNLNLYNTLLTHHKILKHLNAFCSCLEIEINKIDDCAQVSELAAKPRINRNTIVKDILLKYPDFKELYDDYHLIHDLYSLEKIKSYNCLVLSVDPNEDIERYTLIKVLYIMGENLKNTLMCPNLSESTVKLLELSFPKNCSSLLPDLRDLWFHSNELRPWNKNKENWTVEYFADLKKAILDVNEVITDICLEKKYQMTRILLKKITDSKSPDETKEILKLLNKLNFDAIEDYPKVNRLKSIESVIEKLKIEVKIRTSYEEELFRQIREILSLIKDKFKLVKFDYALLSTFEELSYNFLTMNFNESYFLELKYKARDLLDYFKKWELKSLKVVLENTKKIFENASLRFPKSQIESIKFLVVEVNKIFHIDIEELECLLSLKDLLCKNKQQGKKSSRKRTQNDDQINNLLKEIQEFLCITLSKNKSYKTIKDKKWHNAMEVFLLDILTLLDDFKHSFTNNNNFVDSPSPILMGKNLRNHLVHENALFDISFETSRFSLLNAKKFISYNVFQTDNLVDKIIKNNPNKLKINLDHDLKLVTIQNEFFNAVTLGNMDLVRKCIEAGADLNARNDHLWTSLHFAAKGINSEMLPFILQHLHNINPKDIDGQTPLHIAAYFNNISVMKHLVNKSADVNNVDNFGRTPLHIAAQLGHINIVQILLDSNVNIEKNDEKLATPLQYAIENGHLNVVKILYKKKNYLQNKYFPTGCTPLHIASKRGHITLVKFFLESKIDVNSVNDKNDTPLHCAVEFDHEEVAQYLIYAGADINAENVYWKTPINVAVQNGYDNIAAILLDSGVKINCHDISGVTPLHIAACFGHLSIVEKLIHYNSQINTVDNEGKTPLHLAAINGHEDVIKYLLENNAAVDKKDFNGRTPLDFIIKTGNQNLTNFLIQSGINPNKKFCFGKTLLHLAAEFSCKEVVESLIEFGVIDIPDDDGWLALHYCCQNCEQGIANLLLQNGSDINFEDTYKTTPFHLASENGNPDFIDSVINFYRSMDKNIKINFKNRKGFTALHFCVEANQFSTTEILINNGASLNVKDCCGDTPLCVAVMNNSLDMVKLLVSKGADVNASNGKPLRHAILYNSEDIVHFLLERNEININLKDNSLTVLQISDMMGSDIIDYLLYQKSLYSIVQEYEMTPLQLAAMNASVNIVKALLDKGAKIYESTFNCDLSPLHIASLLGNNNVVSLLLEKNAYVDLQLESAFTPLHLAARGGHLQVIRNLLDHNADPYKKNNENLSALEIAILNCNQDAVEILFQHVNTLDAFDKNSTLLHIAAETGNKQMAQYLTSKGADHNAKDNRGYEPFHIAAHFNHVDLVDYFLADRAFNDMDSKDVILLMETAMLHKSTDLLQCLINHKIDVNMRNSNGNSALHIAAMYDNETAIKLLLSNGAFYNILNDNFEEPYEVTENEEIISLFISIHNIFEAVKSGNILNLDVNNKSLFNTKDAYNCTPLHYGARLGFLQCVSYLLDNDANPNVIGENNCTPLHEAVFNAHLHVIVLLLSFGAIYNFPLSNGQTPLNIAINSFNSRHVGLATLRKYGYIKQLFESVNNNFAMVEADDLEVLTALLLQQETYFFKALMCAQNTEKQTLIHFAILKNFSHIEALKQVSPKDFSLHVKEIVSLKRSGNYDNALNLLNDVLSEQIEILGVLNPFTLDTMCMKADLYCQQLRCNEALDLYFKVYEYRKLLFGNNGKDTLKTKLEIASLLHFMGFHEETINICDKIYKSQINNYNNQNDVWYTYYKKGTMFESLGKIEDALDIYLQTIQNKEMDSSMQSEDFIVALKAQNGIARILGKKGKYNEAYKLYQKSFENLSRHECNYSLILETNCEFSVILMKQKKFLTALQLLHKTLSIHLAIFGVKHPRTLIIHQHIAKLYFSQRQYLESYKLFNQTFRELESSLGSNNITVLSSKLCMEKISLVLNFNMSYGTDVFKLTEIKTEEINEHSCEILWNYLFKNRLNVNLKNYNGWSFLHYAAMSGREDVVEILLKNGADIMSVNDLGETALHISASRFQTHIVKMLLKHLENNLVEFNQFINARSVEGNTALHMICNLSFSRLNHDLVTVKYLLKYGAIFNIQNFDLKFPIDLTKNQGIKYILGKTEKFFIDSRNGVDFIDELGDLSSHDILAITNARNLQGNNLLQETILFGSLEAARRLEHLLECIE